MKRTPLGEFFRSREYARLLYADLGARHGLASEAAGANLGKGHDAFLGGMDSKVTAHEGTWTCELGRTGLADQDFSGVDLLATEAFDTQSGAGVVVDVLA